MSRLFRLAALVVCACAFAVTLPADTQAQGRGERADIRLRVTPEEAAVYVDGFYAGVVEDFDGVFEGLPLPPGGHTIVLYLEGYRTAHHNVYLRPASTFKLRDTLERLPAGVTSEPPPTAPAVPPPPAGSYRLPRTPPRTPISPAQTRDVSPARAIGLGTLDLRVQPLTAQITIDGERWVSSDEGHFVLQLPAGTHRVEVDELGYRSFVRQVEISDDAVTLLNVSLIAATR